jgi:bacterioferritin B
MMISAAVCAKLNEQITNEFVASQKYLGMACQFEGMGLKSLAAHFRRQTEEERMHALKILDFVLEVGGTVNLAAMPAPQAQYPSVKAAVESALVSEQTVTRQINDLVALAESEKDYATRSFLQWFVDEQVEEVSSMDHLLRITTLAGENLLQLEQYVRETAADAADAAEKPAD